MTFKKVDSVIVGIALLAAAAPALAQQRPLVTEDPETIGDRRVLVEGGVELDKGAFQPAYGLKGDVTHVALLGVSVGVGPAAEVQVDGGLYQRLHVTERRPGPLQDQLTFTGDSSASFEDLVVATKLRIVPETADHPGFGVRFGTKLPTATRGSGLGLRTTDFFASMLVAKTIQSVRTVGNVSLIVLGDPAAAQGSAKTLGFGLSVARALTNEFETVGEINGRLDPFGSATPAGLESRAVLRLAGRYTYQLLRFDAGLLVGVTSRDPGFGISAGATYVFGP